MFVLLNAFWVMRIYATSLALYRYSVQIETLVDVLGIEGILEPGQAAPVPRPPVHSWWLYSIFVGCTLAWGVILTLIIGAVR